MKDSTPLLVGLTGAAAFVAAYLMKGRDVIAAGGAFPVWKPKGRPLTAEQIGRLAVGAGWRGPDVVTAIAVCLAESAGYPDAFLWNSHADGKASVDRGLWQINSRYHPDLMDADAFDPAANAAAAYRTWKADKRPWYPWIAFRKGAHKRYLATATAAAQAIGAIPSERVASLPKPTEVYGPPELSGARPSISPERIAKLARAAGFTGEDVGIAVAVALAESSGYPNEEAANKDGSINVGLWQINSGAHNIAPKKLYDPVENARQAFRIFTDAKRRHGNGWKPWGAFTDRRYLAFLDEGRKAGEMTV